MTKIFPGCPRNRRGLIGLHAGESAGRGVTPRANATYAASGFSKHAIDHVHDLADVGVDQDQIG
jgi:hypothetical protein